MVISQEGDDRMNQTAKADGEWKLEMTGAFQDIRSYSCSNCGFRLPLNPTKIPLYCEDCGSRMTEEQVYGESET